MNLGRAIPCEGFQSAHGRYRDAATGDLETPFAIIGPPDQGASTAPQEGHEGSRQITQETAHGAFIGTKGFLTDLGRGGV